jgi:hypothetical protein
MTDFTTIARRYITMWNETDEAALRVLVAELFTDDARYVDPIVEVAGHDAIAATVAAVQRQFAGLTFRLAGDVDAHHRQARFSWELGPAGDEALIVGFDVAEQDEDGRLALVLGFLDKVPA